MRAWRDRTPLTDQARGGAGRATAAGSVLCGTCYGVRGVGWVGGLRGLGAGCCHEESLCELAVLWWELGDGMVDEVRSAQPRGWMVVWGQTVARLRPAR